MDIYSDKNVLEFVTVATEYCAFVEKVKKFTKRDFLGKLQKLLPLIYLKTALLKTDDNALSDSQAEAYLSEYEYEYIKRNVSLVLGATDSFISIYDGGDISETQQAEISDCITDVYHNLKNFVENYRSLSEESASASLCELVSDFRDYWGVKLLSLLTALHSLVYFADLEDDDDEDTAAEGGENFYGRFLENYHKKI